MRSMFLLILSVCSTQAALRPAEISPLVHLSWLVENDVQTFAEPFYAPSGGFGLRANESLEFGDIVVSVPRKLLLGLESAMGSLIGPVLKHPKVKAALMQTEENKLYGPLVLNLLHQRWLGRKSTFWPWLQTVPRTPPTPLFWSDEQLGMLNGSLSLHR